MKLVIPGRPVPAVRMTQKDKWKPRAKKYLVYKGIISDIAKKACRGPTNNKVNVSVRVYLFGKTTDMGRDGDIDNYLKSALDGMNKIVFVDDRQVMSATVFKEPCKEEEQRMEIEINIKE